MQKIDSHQNFWHYHHAKHDWIDDAMAGIKNIQERLAYYKQFNAIKASGMF